MDTFSPLLKDLTIKIPNETLGEKNLAKLSAERATEANLSKDDKSLNSNNNKTVSETPKNITVTKNERKTSGNKTAGRLLAGVLALTNTPDMAAMAAKTPSEINLGNTNVKSIASIAENKQVKLSTGTFYYDNEKNINLLKKVFGKNIKDEDLKYKAIDSNVEWLGRYNVPGKFIEVNVRKIKEIASIIGVKPERLYDAVVFQEVTGRHLDKYKNLSVKNAELVQDLFSMKQDPELNGYENIRQAFANTKEESNYQYKNFYTRTASLKFLKETNYNDFLQISKFDNNSPPNENLLKDFSTAGRKKIAKAFRVFYRNFAPSVTATSPNQRRFAKLSEFNHNIDNRYMKLLGAGTSKKLYQAIADGLFRNADPAVKAIGRKLGYQDKVNNKDLSKSIKP
jgi:hypothetical protein